MVTVLQKGGAYMASSDWTLFMIDSADDVKLLPTMSTSTEQYSICAAGSMAMSSDGKTIAMLGNDDK